MNKKLIGQIMVCSSVQIPTAIALGDSVNGIAWITTVAIVGLCASVGHSLYSGVEK